MGGQGEIRGMLPVHGIGIEPTAVPTLDPDGHSISRGITGDRDRARSLDDQSIPRIRSQCGGSCHNGLVTY
jgi:hypothetical protein